MKETPMMKQYLGFKRQYPDKVVLFRMGDFYETFGDDAKVVSKILNITLTTRDKKSDPTPLAGFPYHALDTYLPKLVNADISAVIVDQIEDPKDAVGIVKRGVTRIVTPGTLDGDQAIDEKDPFLMSVYLDKANLGVSYCDLSTGQMWIGETKYSTGEFQRLITSIDPVEILVADSSDKFDQLDNPIGIVENIPKKIDENISRILSFYNAKSLDSLGLDGLTSGVNSLATLLTYIEETQKMIPDHIAPPKLVSFSGTMPLDRSTIRNLDLIRNSYTGELKDSLLEILDDTKTAMGKRLLYKWVLNPLIDHGEIEFRQKIVESLYNDDTLLSDIRAHLAEVSDVERIIGKIGLDRANPKDMRSLLDSLEQFLQILQLVDRNKTIKKTVALENETIVSSTEDIKTAIELIDKYIMDEPSNNIMDGGVIKDGVDEEIDQIRSISKNSKEWLKDFEKDQREKYSIPSLKVSYNRVFGYYIEVTKVHQEKVPSDYIRKQTLVNSERYITEELKEKEDIILNSDEKLAKLEYKKFNELREKLLRYLKSIRTLSELITNFDIFASFANSARLYNYIKPTIYDMGENDGLIKIKNGRHPVVERLIDEQFISNDTYISEKKDRMAIITGPNMSGKSTYIRQIGLIVLMAQIGSYVPASEAEISIVDRLFSRVGASDNLSQGRSTFMVEMEEAANIVNNATSNSLVILDEVGRGTSTYDGVSIAWALVEHLVHKIGARTLFATHYHELTTLEDENPKLVKNYNVGVKEDGDEVIFLRSILEGGTDKSYGIYVAQMAGIPEEIVTRANDIMSGLDIDLTQVGDKRESSKSGRKVELQYAFLEEEGPSDELLQKLRDAQIENMTPIEAISFLQQLKDIDHHTQDKK